MAGSWLPRDFPGLNPANHAITSPATPTYNCIAWAAGDSSRWWWPDRFGIDYWPPGVRRSETVEAFVQAFSTLGYNLCSDGHAEPGIEKIAVFKRSDHDSTPTHVALQLDSGDWISKLGTLEDIRHATVEALVGIPYGVVACYLGRSRR